MADAVIEAEKGVLATLMAMHDSSRYRPVEKGKSMRQRTWMWVGIGILVSTMLIGGVVFAAGQRVSWQVPQATVVGSGNLLPRSDGGAIALPSITAPVAGPSLQPVAVQGGDRSSLSRGQGLLLADGSGDRPSCKGRKGC